MAGTSLTFFYGKPEAGKSILAVNIAAALSEGEPVSSVGLGRLPFHRGSTIRSDQLKVTGYAGCQPATSYVAQSDRPVDEHPADPEPVEQA